MVRENNATQSKPVSSSVEVSKAMKQTEIGLVPEDWAVKNLKEVCWVNQGLQIPITERKLFASEKSKKYITIQFLNDSKEIEYIDDYTSNVVCDFNDVLMTRTGNTGLVITGVEGVFHNNFFKINIDKKLINKRYLVFYLKNPMTQKIIQAKAGTSTIPDLNHNDFYSIQIPLPPLAEQEAIATALSDCDAWIESLEAVIAKKRLIKQGAMQELLTPKEDWEVKKLGEVLQFGSGRDYKHLKVGAIPVYGTGGIMTYVNQHLYEGESVGIGRKGTIDKPVFLKDKFWTVDTLFFTHSFTSVIPKYIYYQFLQIAWKEYNEASGVPSLNKNTLEQIEIKTPSLSKQKRIATVLSDMDAELDALTQKLNKARQIKQGMMQELLTGKVRLV